MLVLSRKAMESLVISHSVLVQVLEVRGNKVKLGIKAPRGVAVQRSELLHDDHGEPKSPGPKMSAGSTMPAKPR